MRTTLVLTLALLGLTAFAGSAAAASTTFYFCDDANPSAPGASVMYIDAPGPCDSGSMSPIPQNTCKTYASDFAAAAAVSFDSANWFGNVIVPIGQATLSPYTYPASLGSQVGATPTFQAPASLKFVRSMFFGVDVGTITSSAVGTVNVPQGGHLITMICNPATSAGQLDVFADGVSYITSPGNSPNYPTPELGTMALAGLGLVGLAVVGRRFF